MSTFWIEISLFIPHKFYMKKEKKTEEESDEKSVILNKRLVQCFQLLVTGKRQDLSDISTKQRNNFLLFLSFSHI